MTKTAAVRPTPYHPAKVPQWALNIQNHLEGAFAPWSIKHPSVSQQISRTLMFFVCALITSLLPDTNLLINGLLILLVWVMLSAISKKLPYWILLLFIMFNVAWLFYIMQLFIPYY